MLRLQRLWSDERGGLISAEYLLLGTFLAIGLIASASAVKDALISKISQIAEVVCK